MRAQLSDQEARRRFAEAGQSQPLLLRHEDAEGKVFMAQAGAARGPTVTFVHGSPGSWETFIHLMSDPSWASRFNRVAVDRPGFGRTEPALAEHSLQTQARRICEAVSTLAISLPAIWIGYSFGGPVVARVAIDYPYMVAGLALIAPSMDPELEKRGWFSWLARLPLLRLSLPKVWRHSNDELFRHKQELEKLKPLLAVIRAPTVVAHGEADKQSPPENARYVVKRFKLARVQIRLLKRAGHLIPWDRPEALLAAVEDLVARRF